MRRDSNSRSLAVRRAEVAQASASADNPGGRAQRATEAARDLTVSCSSTPCNATDVVRKCCQSCSVMVETRLAAANVGPRSRVAVYVGSRVVEGCGSAEMVELLFIRSLGVRRHQVAVARSARVGCFSRTPRAGLSERSRDLGRVGRHFAVMPMLRGGLEGSQRR